MTGRSRRPRDRRANNASQSVRVTNVVFTAAHPMEHLKGILGRAKFTVAGAIELDDVVVRVNDETCCPDLFYPQWTVEGGTHYFYAAPTSENLHESIRRQVLEAISIDPDGHSANLD